MVKEGENGEKIQKGIAYVAPGDYHLFVTSNGRISLQHSPKINGHRPCADVTMRSVAEVYGEKAVGVVLTGMGADGKLGVKSIKKHKGIVLVQDEKSSLLFGMPKEAIATGVADRILPLGQIGSFLSKLVGVKEDG